MIDWKKMNVCDSCNATASEKKPICTFTMTFERTGKKIKLCKNCFKELADVTKRALEDESCTDL